MTNTGLRGADSQELLEFARQFSSLGDAIQQQLAQLMEQGAEDADGYAMTPGALEYCQERIRGYNEDIDAALDEMAQVLGMNTE